MVRVRLEVWMWMGKDLGSDFQSLSEMGSVLDAGLEGGTSVRAFFRGLSSQYPPIGQKIFNRETDQFYPNVVVTLNDRVIGLNEVYDRILQEGDKIKVVPMYVGG